MEVLSGCSSHFGQRIHVDEFNKQYVLSIGMYDNTYSVEDMMGVLKSYTPETNFEEFQKFTEK